MKALPATDPLSWTYQAAIHGSLSGTGVAWNTCEHGTDFFFSWHRMYLWYFERIVRKMSGDTNWALPYWNYEKATERKLPAPFRSPSTPANWLYESNRGFGWNAGTAALGASTVDTTLADSEIAYHDFRSVLEGTPHGAVHVSIGGLMGSVPTAAADPIFWLHHANIDRLWDLWLAKGGGRTDPLGDAAWKTTKFTFFDETGTKVELTGCDVLRAKEQLKYSYQGEPPQVKEYCVRIIPIPHWIIEKLFKLPIPPVIGPGPDLRPLGDRHPGIPRAAHDPVARQGPRADPRSLRHRGRPPAGRVLGRSTSACPLGRLRSSRARTTSETWPSSVHLRRGDFPVKSPNRGTGGGRLPQNRGTPSFWAPRARNAPGPPRGGKTSRLSFFPYPGVPIPISTQSNSSSSR